MYYFVRALQHYIIEIVISIIKLFMGYGLSSFDMITYRQYLKNNNRKRGWYGIRINSKIL